MNAITAAPPQPSERISQAEAAPPSSIAPPQHAHRFTDSMEAALTGIVISGVLLFAGALLRDAAPACAARAIGCGVLTVLPIASGSVSIFFLLRGIFSLLRR